MRLAGRGGANRRFTYVLLLTIDKYNASVDASQGSAETSCCLYARK